MKVLFIGNSHTFFNDMPELFAQFVEATTKEKPEVVALTYSGRDFHWHRKEYFAIRFNLMYGNYDYCVFQQAAHPYPPIEDMMHYGGELIELCKKCNTRPVVYMTWAEKARPENQQKMIDSCVNLASEHKALLAPIGIIWQAVQEKYPDIDLYFKDDEHAGPYGDFLIAASLCQLLSGSISDSICEKGFDFIQDLEIDMESPSVLEDKQLVQVSLDPEKTKHILDCVRTYIE